MWGGMRRAVGEGVIRGQRSEGVGLGVTAGCRISLGRGGAPAVILEGMGADMVTAILRDFPKLEGRVYLMYLVFGLPAGGVQARGEIVQLHGIRSCLEV